MKIKIGDKITALGHTFEVARIIYQAYFDGEYDVEFLDPKGGYHHWKSEFDGGFVTKGVHVENSWPANWPYEN